MSEFTMATRTRCRPLAFLRYRARMDVTTPVLGRTNADPSQFKRPSDRAIKLLNFREVGGTPCADGRRVRRSRLFRSATPDFATPTDLLFLERLGVRTVLDLRTEPERRESPLRNVRVHTIPILTQVWDPGSIAATSLPPERFLADRYLEMCELGAERIAECFAVLAESSASPALVHCTAGKDRTGVLVALLLASFGVDTRVIAEDYAMSALAMAELVALIRDQTPERLDAMVSQPSAFLSAPRETMHLFLADLAARYGSATRFLLGAGITEEHLDALAEHFTAVVR